MVISDRVSIISGQRTGGVESQSVGPCDRRFRSPFSNRIKDNGSSALGTTAWIVNEKDSPGPQSICLADAIDSRSDCFIQFDYPHMHVTCHGASLPLPMEVLWSAQILWASSATQHSSDGSPTQEPTDEPPKPTESGGISVNNGGVTAQPTRLPGTHWVVERPIVTENNSETPVTIGKVNLVGDPSFSIRYDHCQGKELPPKQTCDIMVDFENPGPGDYSAELIVHLFPNDSSKSIQLQESGETISTPTSSLTSPPTGPPISK